MGRFDVVIAGAGTAGSLAAKTSARAGLKVCCVDIKEERDIGRKICGDAIGKHHFENLQLKEPTADELERIMTGVKIFSPDQRTSYVVKGEKLFGYVLNRYRFGQRLFKEAVDAGVKVLSNTQVMEPIVKKGCICGVSTRNVKTGEKKVLYSSLVIDATGFVAAIRRRLHSGFGIDGRVDKKDVEACYREIRMLKEPLDETSLCQIYLNQATCPGGYYWIFPESENKVNVGLGVAMTENFPNPKDRLYQHVLSQPLFHESVIIDKGAWFVPTRRPLDSMVGNGIMIVGDAACQVNPIHGGGMGPSMIGGTLAGKTAAFALEKDDVSRRGMWNYNVEYIRDYGAKQAGLEIFRILLQCMDDYDLNYGMKYKLLTEEDVLKASIGEDAQVTATEKAKRALRGIKRFSLIRRLSDAAKLMKDVKALYRDYPTRADDLEKWKAQVEKIFNETKTRLE